MCPTTTGMFYDSAMEDVGEQQVVAVTTLRGRYSAVQYSTVQYSDHPEVTVSVLHHKSVPGTDGGHEAPVSTSTLARLLDMRTGCWTLSSLLTFISSLLMLVLSKLMSTEYLVGIMWL